VINASTQWKGARTLGRLVSHSPHRCVYIYIYYIYIYIYIYIAHTSVARTRAGLCLAFYDAALAHAVPAQADNKAGQTPAEPKARARAGADDLGAEFCEPEVARRVLPVALDVDKLRKEPRDLARFIARRAAVIIIVQLLSCIRTIVI